MMKENLSKALFNEIVDYEQTVKAILAFAAFVTHDGEKQLPEAEFGIGRRMETSSGNPVNPESEVTPDVVCQKTLEYGIVAEVKKSLPQDREYWHRYYNQLR